MLKVIDDQLTIKKYARQFVRNFKPFIDERVKVKLGHQGASSPAKVLWSKKLGIWLFSHAVNEVRYWNAFGVEKPRMDRLVPIITEINFPFAGIDRKTGGAFARDARGNVYVIHRGKIGGGKKGVGKSLFENNYRGVWSLMEDGDCITQVAVIGVLNSPRLVLQTAFFVKKIELLKSAAFHSPQLEIDFPEVTFREDLIGSLPSADEADLDACCDHDLVVSSLAAHLKQGKFQTGNDGTRELFLADPLKSRKSHVFEVITDAQEKNVLAAAAKLLLQKADDKGDPLAFLILPEAKMAAYAGVLQKIGITAVGFCLDVDRITFPDLGKIRLDFK
jgi:hypothetical protein